MQLLEQIASNHRPTGSRVSRLVDGVELLANSDAAPSSAERESVARPGARVIVVPRCRRQTTSSLSHDHRSACNGPIVDQQPDARNSRWPSPHLSRDSSTSTYVSPNVGYPASRLLFTATIDLRSGRPTIVD